MRRFEQHTLTQLRNARLLTVGSISWHLGLTPGRPPLTDDDEHAARVHRATLADIDAELAHRGKAG